MDLTGRRAFCRRCAARRRGDLTRALPDARAVIVKTFGRPGYLRRALAQGAAGFLLKDAPGERDRQVVAGRRAIDPTLAAAAITQGKSPLTAREEEVLRAAQSHETAADIAAALLLCEGAVRLAHRHACISAATLRASHPSDRKSRFGV